MIDIDQLSKDVTLLYEQSKNITSDQHRMASATQFVLSEEKQVKTQLVLFLLDENILHSYDNKLRCVLHTMKNIHTQNVIDLSLSPIENIIQTATSQIDEFVNNDHHTKQKAKEEQTQQLILDVLSDDNILQTRATLKQLIEMDEKCTQDFAQWAKSQCLEPIASGSATFHKNSIPGFLRSCLEIFWMGMLKEGDEYTHARTKFKQECFRWVDVVRWSGQNKPSAEDQKHFSDQCHASFEKIFDSEDLISGYFSNVREVNVQDVLRKRAQQKSPKNEMTP